VCAHNDDALETAVFANVELTEGAPPALGEAFAHQYARDDHALVQGSARRVVDSDLIEAPNWLPDGTHLFFNSKGAHPPHRGGGRRAGAH
jgi:hypothetical protein